MELMGPKTLTKAQEARRQRVIDAAMVLAADGGYEAVQMRDVAARADVAMGTVYRYFTSKDHLLAASLVHWVEQLYAQLGARPPRSHTSAGRVEEVLDRALRSLDRAPKLGAALFTSLSSQDPEAVACQQQIITLMDAIVLQAIGDPTPSRSADRSRMIGHVWYSAMVSWINGWAPISHVYCELVVAVELLLPEESSPSDSLRHRSNVMAE